MKTHTLKRIMNNLLLILFLCCFNSVVSGQVSQQDRKVLLELFKDTGGENWIHTWDLEKPISLSLNLSFNSLNGELPEGITMLSKLKVLKLEMNRLRGKLPKDMGNLENLKELSVFNNYLSGFLKILWMVLFPQKWETYIN